MVQDLAKWFAEHGAMSSHQFAKHPKRPVGIKLRDIKRICGGWDRLITYVSHEYPDYWRLAQPQKKVEKDPLEDYFKEQGITKDEKPDPLAALRASSIEK